MNSIANRTNPRYLRLSPDDAMPLTISVVIPAVNEANAIVRAIQHSWPRLLEGPVHVHARRWQDRGILRQTLQNWALQCAHLAGVSPARLAKFYPAHDVAET